MSYDFTFQNPELKDWFDEGLGEPPVRQFVYLHEHPLVRPNFITEVEMDIYRTGQHMVGKGIRGSAAKKLSEAGKEFASTLEAFTLSRGEGEAEEVLRRLRTLYRLCKAIRAL